MMQLKPGQRRRLAAEQAIYKKFSNFREANEACIRYANSHGMEDVTFNTVSIQQYIGCQTNLSLKRLKILASVLGVTNYAEMDEIFVAPKHRGEGLYWEGENGTKVKDIDLSAIG